MAEYIPPPTSTTTQPTPQPPPPQPESSSTGNTQGGEGTGGDQELQQQRIAAEAKRNLDNLEDGVVQNGTVQEYTMTSGVDDGKVIKANTTSEKINGNDNYKFYGYAERKYFDSEKNHYVTEKVRVYKQVDPETGEFIEDGHTVAIKDSNAIGKFFSENSETLILGAVLIAAIAAAALFSRD